MSIFTKLGVSVAAPFNADGSARNISPQDFQIWMTEVERLIKGLLAGVGGVELPELIYKYVITGGNQNNITAVPNAEVTAGAGEALFTIDISQANTGDVRINGKPLLTSSGNQIVAGGLVSGIWLFLDEGANFRLVSDQASQAILTAAENAEIASQLAQEAAENARDLAAGYVNDIVSEKEVPIFGTRLGLVNLSGGLPQGMSVIEVRGDSSVSDSLGGVFVRVDKEPLNAHPQNKLRTQDRYLPNGAVSTSNGGWWMRKTSPIIPKNEPITIIAHRGFRMLAPENTIASWSSAVSLGYRQLEGDIRISQDGVPMFVHDASVDRTTNGTGNVADLTAVQIQALDAGSWFGNQYRGTRIPKFSEILEYAKGNAEKIWIEVKSVPEAKIQEIILMIETAGMIDTCNLSSFQTGSLIKARSINRTLELGLLHASDWSGLDLAIQLAPCSMILDYSVIIADPAKVKLAHAFGVDVVAYNVNTREVASSLAHLGINKIIADSSL